MLQGVQDQYEPKIELSFIVCYLSLLFVVVL